MRKGFRNFVSCLCVLSLVFFIGCDGGGGDDDSSESTAAAVPTWTGAFHMTNPDGQQETINLEQNNNDITGSTTLGGTATGTANGSNAEITINYPDSYVIILNLTINITIINGTFSDSEGREGTVEATKDGGSNSSSSSSTSDGSGDSSSSSSTSVSGNWNLVITHTEDANTGTATFIQSGTSLTGECIAGGRAYTVTGTIDGNKITWRVVAKDDPSYVVNLSGTVDGDSMSGTYIAHDGNTGTWSATKGGSAASSSSNSISGTWAFTLQGAAVMGGTMTLTQNSNDISGTGSDSDGVSFSVSGNLSGNSVTLNITSPSKGATVVMTGQLSSSYDEISGDWIDSHDYEGTFIATRQ